MNTQLKPWKSYANWMLGALVVNVFLCFFLVGMLLLIPIGIWQVIDALVYAYYGDRRRKWYLVVVGLYLPFLFIIPQFKSIFDGALMLLFVILIPYCIAFWYWSIVSRHAEEIDLPVEAEVDDLERHLIG